MSETSVNETKAALDAAFRAILNQPPHPCSLGHHLISATAQRDGREWAICANCSKSIRLRKSNTTPVSA
jgi:hypothetical protein